MIMMMICERKYLSLYPQAINYILLYFLFPLKPLCSRYLTTALNLLGSSTTLRRQLNQYITHPADGIGLHANADKTEYMSFNKKKRHSPVIGDSLKLEDKFTCFGSNVSSTEICINMWLMKVWSVIHRLSIIWKSNLSDKIKHNFPKQWLCRVYMDAPHGSWLSV